MQQLLAIALLTWKAAFRFRLFWVLAGLLLSAVVFLPLMLKDDGTARGLTQILLTYNLSVITLLLGFATLWLSCGTLARDIEDCQLQLVAVKPVPRWRVWLGKWLGIMLLNTVLLAVAGGSVYVLLQWRARGLPPAQRAILDNEVFVARGSLREPMPDIAADTEQIFRQTLQRTPVPPVDQPFLRKQVEEYVKGRHQIVGPNQIRFWEFQLGWRRLTLRDQPLYLRTRFHAAQTNLTGTYVGLWQVGAPNSTNVWRAALSQAADAFHEIRLPPNLFSPEGVLRIEFLNRNETSLLFPLEDSLEVLYREGGFGLNYARGLAIILCWLGLLAALGLAAASLLSFPVAAFCSLSLLAIALSSGTLASVVEEGTVGGLDHETGQAQRGWLDLILIPLFKVILKVVNLAEAFSPVDSLSSGRSITWGQVGLAWVQIVLLLGGVLALAGMVILSRRELATASGHA